MSWHLYMHLPTVGINVYGELRHVLVTRLRLSISLVMQPCAKARTWTHIPDLNMDLISSSMSISNIAI